MALSEKVKEIISTARKNESRELNLVGCRIRAEGVNALAKELKQMPNLTSLNLGYNLIEKEGAMALAQNLPNTLTDLDLRGNNIGKEGAMALAKELKQMPIILYQLGFFNSKSNYNITKR